MTNHIHHYQHYALNEAQELVEIHNTHKGDECVYYCPYCKQEMTPKRGPIKTWHFAHKIDNAEKCSYDNYLHSLAEKKIEQWYKESDEINIILPFERKCADLESCRWQNKMCITSGLQDPINLKKYYDLCELEKEFETSSGVFRADIMLSSSQFLNDPIFIEVCVTHPCTQEKIDSGLRIIEIKIESEEDIEKFIADNSIKYQIEGDNLRHIKPEIIFYGFKHTKRIDPSYSINLFKYVFYSNQDDEIVKINCRMPKERKGVMEVTALGNSENNQDWRMERACYLKAVSLGLTQPSCEFCQHRCGHINYPDTCKLHNKYGTPEFCKNGNAFVSCKYYKLGRWIIEYELLLYSKLAQEYKFELWHNNNSILTHKTTT